MAIRLPSRRDAILIFFGALCMHFFAVLTPSSIISHSVGGQPDPYKDYQAIDIVLEGHIAVDDVQLPSPPPANVAAHGGIPQTTLVEHVPGWTVFRDIYMANGTLFIVSSSPESFPEIRYMTSTGLAADVTPENIAAREPTSRDMDFLSPAQAAQRWGARRQHVWTVDGNTILFNDPSQFLAHYYHFCAELLVGAWSFWTGAAHPDSPPPIHRAIFPHTSGWRDGPGFNSYFLRAAFPSLTVEVDVDWEDRIKATSSRAPHRAWHFPYLLLADRSAAFRGRLCGSQNQRTASESVDGLVGRHKLDSEGLWWRPVKNAVWRFAGVTGVRTGAEGSGGTVKRFEETDKFTITYISRQGVRRSLIPEDHDLLVKELTDLVARKNAEMTLTGRGKEWALNVVQAQLLSKDEQVHLAAQTNVLLGVHGNGLSHLVLMPRTRVSAVVEIFYPGAFAHDYEWTARALGLQHYVIWNDTYTTQENTPRVDYPEGFQSSRIPAHGPAIANLIESRILRGFV